MKSFWCEWLVAVQVLVVVSVLGFSVLRVDATSRQLLPEGARLVQLGEHMYFEPAPPGLLFIEESDPTEVHQEQRKVGTLRTYRPRPRPRLLASKKKPKKKPKKKSGKNTPTGAPPPPRNMRRFVLSPPPAPPSIP